MIDPSGVFNIAVVQPKKPTAASTATPDNVTPMPKPTEQPAATASTKPSTFYIPLEADEFINYVGWQMEQLKAISIAFDDSKIVAINNDKLLVLPD